MAPVITEARLTPTTTSPWIPTKRHTESCRCLKASIWSKRKLIWTGARSLLVSRCYVDSYATVALITKAFDALKRDPKIGRAGALRQAMLSLSTESKDTWHPSKWAPFVVVGEGQGQPDRRLQGVRRLCFAGRLYSRFVIQSGVLRVSRH